MATPIKVILLDIGGVLLTDGWETHSRERAATHFSLDALEFQQRHRNVFDAYESGKISLDEYLKLTVFYKQRAFTTDDFKAYMLNESQPLKPMLDFMAGFKKQNALPIVAVNNEPKELNEHRIAQYELTSIIDFFVSSCYVNMRKPDPRIYNLALSMVQATPEQALYIDDREVYTELAASLGINAIHHTSVQSTALKLQSFGLNTSASLL